MAITDILTSGQQPITSPTALTTENVLPDWYTNYAMDILASQKATSGTPYQAYGGPRIAGFSPEQLAAFGQTGTAAGAYQPSLGKAEEAATGALGMSATGAAAPYLGAAGAPSTGYLSTFMNPYSEMVAERVGDMGRRTLTEKLLPAIGDQFVGAGGYGGSRQAEAIGRAVRDTQESISAEQAAVLERGYGQSLTAAQNEANRMAGLAGTAGNLAQSDRAGALAGSSQLGGLAEMAQRLGLTGAGSLAGVGAMKQGMEQQNLSMAYEDFLRQQGYPQEQINAMTSTLKGVAGAVPTSQLKSGYAGTGESTPGTLGTAINTGANLAALANALKGLF
jgi:hypothetical protein